MKLAAASLRTARLAFALVLLAGAACLAGPAAAQEDTDPPQFTANPIWVFSSPGNDGTYGIGDIIKVRVAFTEAVTVTTAGDPVTHPRFQIFVGTQIKHAQFNSGSGTALLVFHYTVQEGDKDTNGIFINDNALELGEANIADEAGNVLASAQLPVVIGTLQQHQVDGTPKVNSVRLVSTPTGDADGDGTKETYKLGDTVRARVTFNSPVNVVGRPVLKLQFAEASGEKTMTFDTARSRTNTTTLEFTYTVAAGDLSTQGIAFLADKLSLPGGARIRGAQAATAADLTFAKVDHNSGHQVDGISPKFAANPISVTSSAGDDGIYRIGDAIEVTLTFTKVVKVDASDGTPFVDLLVGGSSPDNFRRAMYHSGGGTTKLVFRYTVQEGDLDTNGISIPFNAFTGNGGLIIDAAGNLWIFERNGTIGPLAEHQVNGQPKVSAVALVSTPTVDANGDGTNDTYKVGDTVRARVTFNSAVDVTGSPVLKLQFAEASGEKTMTFDTARSRTNTTTLEFTYTVAAGDLSTQGIAFLADKLSVGQGASILGAQAGTAVDLGFAKVDHDPGHKVNGVRPKLAATNTISVTSSPGDDGTYGIGDAIEVTVTFNEAVTVTTAGNPVTDPNFQVVIGFGQDAWKDALYHSGSGTTDLVFRYTVKEGDLDADGISIPSGALSLGQGRIENAAGNQLDPSTRSPAVGRLPGHKVDGTQLKVSAVALVSTPTVDADGDGTNDTYKPGDTVRARVTFNSAVDVTGSPVLKLQFAETYGEKTMTFDTARGRTNTTTLEFTYTVVAGNLSTQGIAFLANKLSVGQGASILGALAETAVDLSFAKVDHDPGHKVDGVKPRLAATNTISVTSSPGTDGTYGIGDVIDVTVRFNEAVTVTTLGNPVTDPNLQVAVGVENDFNDWNSVPYHSGSGTTDLVFRYTVKEGDVDADGISVPANAIALGPPVGAARSQMRRGTRRGSVSSRTRAAAGSRTTRWTGRR